MRFVTKQHLSRRTLLKGLGTAVALPLDCLPNRVSYDRPAHLLTIQQGESEVTASIFKDYPAPDQSAFQAQLSEAGVPYFTVSGDFNNDGFDEIAILTANVYAPTQTKIPAVFNIEVFSPVGDKLLPVGVWFRAQEDEFDVGRIRHVVSGNFNDKGGDDIAVFYDYGNFVSILVFESKGSSFSKCQTYYTVGRDEFDVGRIRHVVSGNFNGKGGDDIAVFYDYGNFVSILVFESKGSSFSKFQTYYTVGRDEFDVGRIRHVVSGNFNGKGGDDIAVFYDYGDFGSILVFESKGSSFLRYKDYLTVGKTEFIFGSIRSVAAGNLGGRQGEDIAVFYDYGDRATIFVFEWTAASGAGFLAPKEYRTALKRNFRTVSLICGKLEDPEVSATIWKGNKKAAVTFSFDDGCESTFSNAIDYMTQKRVFGTYYIITNHLDDDPARLELLKLVKTAKESGHEIGSHATDHGTIAGPWEEVKHRLIDSKTKLDKLLNQKTTSFSFPGGQFTYDSLTYPQRAGYLSARCSHVGYNLATPLDCNALRAEEVLPDTPFDSDRAPSVFGWMKTAAGYGYWLILMYHVVGVSSTVGETCDNKPVRKDEFVKHVDAALDGSMRGNFWVDTHSNVYKYIRERNALKILHYERISGNSIALVVDDGLTREVYDAELTLRIRLPNAWPKSIQNVSISKANFTVRKPVVDENGRKYVYFDTVPDGRKVTISSFI